MTVLAIFVGVVIGSVPAYYIYRKIRKIQFEGYEDE